MRRASLLFSLLCLGGAALAAAGSVVISAPMAGATLQAGASNIISYEVDPGPHGEHVHLYDNGREIAVLRRLKGGHPLGSLAPGAHELCIKVVNHAHVPIGIENCVQVKVQ
jgi:hypothetical protein